MENFATPALWITFAALFAFGFAYDRLVAWLKQRTTGYTSITVVVGVAVTLLAAIPLIGWPNVLTIALLFVASGFWMIVGSLMRHAKKEAEAAAKEARKAAKKSQEDTD